MAGLEKAASTEFDPDCPEPVIATMAEQHAFVDGAGDLGGTMRLGLYPADLQGRLGRARGVRRATRSRSATGTATRSTTTTASQLEAAGLVFSGTSPGRQPRRVRRAARPTCTPTTSPPRPTRSCARGRPGRTRCSPGWSRPRSSGSASCSIPIDESALRRRWVAEQDDEDDRGVAPVVGPALVGQEHEGDEVEPPEPAFVARHRA